MTARRLSLPLLAACALALPAQAQQPKTGPTAKTTEAMMVMPDGPTPAWAPNIDPQMQAVIEQFGASEPPMPITQLSAFQFRNATLPAAAVMELVHKTGTRPMAPKVDVAHQLLPVGPEDGLLVRTYTPLAGVGPQMAGPKPVIVYFHGGGWVIADLDTYEGGAMGLAQRTGAIVVSVAYRQAPEHPFPAAHDDAFAAYTWVTENAASMGGDPMRIATAGESAGGNLAVATALRAMNEGVRAPVHVLAVYPIADGDTDSASYTEYADALPLSKPLMAWFFDRYAPDWRTREYAPINLTGRDYKGFPPTTIVNAQIDPLEAEGGELERKMRADGVAVTRKVYMGVTHEFFGMTAVLEQAVEAQEYAAARMGLSFKK